MYSAIIIWATFYYIVWGRHTFSPPTAEIKETIVGLDRFYADSDRSLVPEEHVVAGGKTFG